MSPGESHQISAAPVAPFKLAEEVSHGGIGIRHGEREPVGFAARRQGHGYRIASNFNAGRTVSKHDTHQFDPQKTSKNQSAIGRVSYSWETVPISFLGQPCANNHPVDKVMSQGMSYGQAPNFLGIRRVGHPLPPACSPEPSEQATPAVRLRPSNVPKTGRRVPLRESATSSALAFGRVRYHAADAASHPKENHHEDLRALRLGTRRLIETCFLERRTRKTRTAGAAVQRRKLDLIIDCKALASAQSGWKASTQFRRSPLRRERVMSSCSKTSRTSGDTLVRKQAEHVAPETKPTPIRKGHWRNRWAGFIGEPNPHWGYGFWPSAEIAEQKAVEHIRAGRNSEENYLGPAFFPETSPP